MLLINDPNRVMFYQDDLIVSYKDFLLIIKYFEEHVFKPVIPAQAGISILEKQLVSQKV